MNQKIKGIHIDERDLKFFTYLHAVKVATYEQAQRDIYSDICLDAAGLRIRKLEDAKFVEIERSRLLMGGKRYVCIKKNTFDDFVRKGHELRIELKSDAIKHDLTLVDIRSQFLKSPKTCDYQTENQIQTWDIKNKHLNSDALVTSQLKETKLAIPIEYESSLKKADRYEPFLKKYYQAIDFPLVILIADSQNVIDRVTSIEKSLFNWDKPKFFYKLTSDLLASESLQFANCHNFALNL